MTTSAQQYGLSLQSLDHPEWSAPDSARQIMPDELAAHRRLTKEC